MPKRVFQVCAPLKTETFDTAPNLKLCSNRAHVAISCPWRTPTHDGYKVEAASYLDKKHSQCDQSDATRSFPKVRSWVDDIRS